MAAVLAKHRKVVRIESPGTLDGGDVLQVDGGLVFVGLSSRTNADGAAQLGRILREHGQELRTVPIAAGLHFKSSVNSLGGKRLLVTPDFAERDELRGHELMVVEAEEACAANTLWINGTLIMPRGFPHTRRQLEALGMPIVELDVSELQKMDGGLTCLSLRL